MYINVICVCILYVENLKKQSHLFVIMVILKYEKIMDAVFPLLSFLDLSHNLN